MRGDGQLLATGGASHGIGDGKNGGAVLGNGSQAGRRERYREEGARRREERRRRAASRSAPARPCLLLASRPPPPAPTAHPLLRRRRIPDPCPSRWCFRLPLSLAIAALLSPSCLPLSLTAAAAPPFPSRRPLLSLGHLSVALPHPASSPRRRPWVGSHPPSPHLVSQRSGLPYALCLSGLHITPTPRQPAPPKSSTAPRREAHGPPAPGARRLQAHVQPPSALGTFSLPALRCSPT